MCSDGYPAGHVIKFVDIEITSKRTIGLVFKKYVVRGEVIIDGCKTGNVLEWQVSQREFKSLGICERIGVPSQWCGKLYSFSDFDLPNHRMIVSVGGLNEC